MNIKTIEDLTALGQAARQASRDVSRLATDVKNQTLLNLAAMLESDAADLLQVHALPLSLYLPITAAETLCLDAAARDQQRDDGDDDDLHRFPRCPAWAPLFCKDVHLADPSTARCQRPQATHCIPSA